MSHRHLVLLTWRRVLADREADERDLMITVTQLREEAGQLASGPE